MISNIDPDIPSNRPPFSFDLQAGQPGPLWIDFNHQPIILKSNRILAGIDIARFGNGKHSHRTCEQKHSQPFPPPRFQASWWFHYWQQISMNAIPSIQSD